MLVIMYEAVEDSVQVDCLHRILGMCFVLVVCQAQISIHEIKGQAGFLAEAIQGIGVLHWRA